VHLQKEASALSTLSSRIPAWDFRAVKLFGDFQTLLYRASLTRQTI